MDGSLPHRPLPALGRPRPWPGAAEARVLKSKWFLTFPSPPAHSRPFIRPA